MTLTERAEKIARENIFILKATCGDPIIIDICDRKNIVDVIAAALNAFAEERVKEVAEYAALAVRNAALEEAAKVCDNWKNDPIVGEYGKGQSITAYGIQRDILALRDAK